MRVVRRLLHDTNHRVLRLAQRQNECTSHQAPREEPACIDLQKHSILGDGGCSVPACGYPWRSRFLASWSLRSNTSRIERSSGAAGAIKLCMKIGLGRLNIRHSYLISSAIEMTETVLKWIESCRSRCRPESSPHFYITDGKLYQLIAGVSDGQSKRGWLRSTPATPGRPAAAPPTSLCQRTAPQHHHPDDALSLPKRRRQRREFARTEGSRLWAINWLVKIRAER